MNVKKLFVVVSIFIFISITNVFAYDIRVESDLTQDQFDDIKNIVVKAEVFRGNRDKNVKYVMHIVDTLEEEVKAISDVEAYTYLVKVLGKLNRNVFVQILTGPRAPSRILQKDVSMWFYKPGTKNSLRISPAQKLLGEVAYADVSFINYAHFYDPIKIENVMLGDLLVYDITLKRVKNSIPYDTIHFFVNKENNRPVKADFFISSGKKIKSMYFREFGDLNGVVIAKQWVIVDESNKKAITYINIKSITNNTLSRSVFTAEGMKDL